METIQKINKEIQRLNWWINHSPAKDIQGKDADMAFIDYSEKGIKPRLEELQNPIRYKQLVEAKRWQGITMRELWEQGILDGSVPYWVLLGGENPAEIPPQIIVDFMKKEMFKGRDKTIIDKVYKDVLRYWNWRRKLLYKFFNY